MEPASETIIKITDHGDLELTLPSMDISLVYNYVGATMWVMLCMHKWNIYEAAQELADVWESDLTAIHSQMQDWVVHLFGAGVLRV